MLFHQNNQFQAKTACLADFSILSKIAVSGPYRRRHLVGRFFWLSFSNVKNTLRILLKHSRFFLSSKQSYRSKNGMFCGLFKFDQNRCIQTLPAWPFFWLIFWNVKIHFEFFWNIQNFVLSLKQSVWSKNSMFCELFNFDQNCCIRTLPAWPFFWLIFWLIFWNVENTLLILLKHSKYCSFIKTISLMQKQHVLRTFQLWPKSMYPDITGVAILLVDFFFWVFQMLKIPFEFFWNIQNFVLSSKQLVWSKNSMFWGLFNFDQNRCIRTLPAWPFCYLIFLVDFFGWFLEMLKIPFEFFWNIQNVVLSSKQSVWSKNSMFCGLFNFDQNRCILSLPAWPFFWLIFEMLKIPLAFFWKIKNFVLSSKQSVWSKNSMFCGLFNFDQNRCIRTLPAWPFC